MKTKRKKTGGRKKGEPTVVVRIPLVAKDSVKKFVLDLRNEKGEIKTIHPMP